MTNQDPIDIRYDYFKSVSHVMVYIPDIGYIDGYDFYLTEDDYFFLWEEERYRHYYSMTSKKLNNLRFNYSWNNCYHQSQNNKLEKIIQKHINGKRRSLCKKK